MPLDRRAAVQLGLLLLALPAQYMLTMYYGSSTPQRQHALQKLLSTAVGFKDRYLSWEHWQNWCIYIISQIQNNKYTDSGGTNDLGESPAVEVLKYRDQGGDFGTSTKPRSPRPHTVKYRIGQVIRHKKWGYRGVIVGWDPVAKAPEEWLKMMHPPDKSHWRSLPNYSVLVDARDRTPPQKTYVVEENIEIVVNKRVIHPELDEYFEEFDGAQYLARPWLKKLYPHD